MVIAGLVAIAVALFAGGMVFEKWSRKRPVKRALRRMQAAREGL